MKPHVGRVYCMLKRSTWSQQDLDALDEILMVQDQREDVLAFVDRDRDNYDLFLVACQYAPATVVRRFLAMGCKPNYSEDAYADVGSMPETQPLHCAFLNKRYAYEVTEALLKAGAVPGQFEDYCFIEWMMVRNRDVPYFHLVYEHYAKSPPRFRVPNKTLLLTAIVGGSAPIVRHMVQACGGVDEIALEQALVARAHMDVVQLLLDSGAPADRLPPAMQQTLSKRIRRAQARKEKQADDVIDTMVDYLPFDLAVLIGLKTVDMRPQHEADYALKKGRAHAATTGLGRAMAYSPV